MKKNLLSGLAKPLAALLAAGLCLSAEQAAAQTQAYKLWPLRVNNQDSAAVRSANVTASTPTLKRFVLSSGLPPSGTVNATPTYSSKYGQAFAPNADGSGWGTSATPPGPGGTNSKRLFYEQFTLTATGASVRADSIILKSAFMLTASSTTLSVAYSKSNFVSDSTAITGGTGPGGGTVGGGFASTTTQAADGPAPIPLSQVDTNVGNFNVYRLALAGANGVTITAGQTLTVRLYFSCSSTGIGRYALLKDVLIKSRQSTATATHAAKATANLNVYPNPAQQQFSVAHAAAKAGAKVAVYSATGRLVATAAVQAGSAVTPVNVNGLASGIYLVEYTDGQLRSTSKIVKE